MNLDETRIEIVAIYTRYSTEELQKASTDDQIRQCKRVCQEKSWLVDEAFIRSDEGLSGATLAARPALKSLLDDIERSGGRITGLVIDNTSRLGRNLGDVMNICALLKFLGVFVYFVASDLDSRHSHFYQTMVQLAQGDEQFLINLAANVRRGHRYRVVDGMIHGGRYYGYKSVIVPDRSRRGSVTRPAVLGVKLCFEPAEIAAARKVWDWALQGLGYISIARKCEEESLPRCNPDKPWTFATVGCILRNQLYRGRFIWGRTTSMKDPRTGKIIQKKVPQKDWVTSEVPELAIVSEEEWQRAHAIIAAHLTVGKSRLGGMGRVKGPDLPFMSGKLFCGVCKGPIVLVGTTPDGDRRYGCKRHRYYNNDDKIGCKNRHIVHCSVIEKAIISHIVDQVLAQNMLDLAIDRCHSGLRERAVREKQVVLNRQSSAQQLKVEIGRLYNEQQNLKAAIRKIGADDDLLAEYEDIRARLKTLNSELGMPEVAPPEVNIDEVRQFVIQRADRIKEMLVANRRAAREALIIHLGDIVLYPEIKNGLPVYRVEAILKMENASKAA